MSYYYYQYIIRDFLYLMQKKPSQTISPVTLAHISCLFIPSLYSRWIHRIFEFISYMISFNLQHEDTHNHPFFRLLLIQVLLPLPVNWQWRTTIRARTWMMTTIMTPAHMNEWGLMILIIIMLVVLVLNSFSSILVCCHSCVSCITVIKTYAPHVQ